MPKFTPFRVEISVGGEHLRPTENIRPDELTRRATSPMASWRYRRPAEPHQKPS